MLPVLGCPVPEQGTLNRNRVVDIHSLSWSNQAQLRKPLASRRPKHSLGKDRGMHFGKQEAQQPAASPFTSLDASSLAPVSQGPGRHP